MSHSCSDILHFMMSPSSHITDQHLPDSTDWFINGSAGYAIIQGEATTNSPLILSQILELSPLPPGATSRQAELMALT